MSHLTSNKLVYCSLGACRILVMRPATGIYAPVFDTFNPGVPMAYMSCRDIAARTFQQVDEAMSHAQFGRVIVQAEDIILTMSVGISRIYSDAALGRMLHILFSAGSGLETISQEIVARAQAQFQGVPPGERPKFTVCCSVVRSA